MSKPRNRLSEAAYDAVEQGLIAALERGTQSWRLPSPPISDPDFPALPPKSPQTIIDKGHEDWRRARACGQSLIPTTTGSARAITQIFPELTGKLNSHAVRVPLTNASLTDCVFETRAAVSVEEVNAAFVAAAKGELAGVLGFESKRLVSIDYLNDARSAVIDGPCTKVVDET